jgi:hypothetical protein
MKSLPFVAATLLLFCVSLRADDTVRLASLFTKMQPRGTLTIPPGDYWLDGTKPILLHFVNNTTKCENHPRRGRRTFVTGDYERYAELYFTTHEAGGRYGNVTVRGSIFTSGSDAEHTITFAPGGDTILISDNIFSGPIRDIAPATGSDNVTIRNIIGLPNQP